MSGDWKVTGSFTVGSFCDVGDTVTAKQFFARGCATAIGPKVFSSLAKGSSPGIIYVDIPLEKGGGRHVLNFKNGILIGYDRQ